jgi:hypothetical protein
LGKVLRYCPHCGVWLVKPRRPRAHRFFFAIIRAAYDNWPEAHPEFQPVDEDQLRAWLLCRTKHSARVGNLLNIRGPVDAAWEAKLADFVAMAVIAVRQHGYALPVTDESGYIELIVPKSIAYEQLGEEEFAPIRDDVFALIEANTGMKLKELRSHVKASEGRFHPRTQSADAGGGETGAQTVLPDDQGVRRSLG